MPKVCQIIEKRGIAMLESVKMRGTPDAYLERLTDLQQQLRHLQLIYMHQQRQAVIVFEGWDAAGKGGIIRRLSAVMDPRGFQVWPIGVPESFEQHYPYLHRFWQKLPRKGMMSVFDRSWYGRVLVERVESLIPPADWQRAYGEIRDFETQLHNTGVRVIKIFLHITPDEQAKRFRDRLDTPHKQWKLTVEDFRNREKWASYEEAITDMLDKTHMASAPWVLVGANSKKFARLEALQHILDHLSADINLTLPAPDARIFALAAEKLKV